MRYPPTSTLFPYTTLFRSKLRTAIENLGRILAVELTCAAHGLDLRAPLAPGPGGAAALGAVRARIEGPGPDRRLAPDLAAAEELVAAGAGPSAGGGGPGGGGGR